MPIFNFRNPIEYPLGLLELLTSGATGAVGQLAGVPIGLLKSADKYGTQEGVREAEKEAQRVSSALTYLPRTETAREMAGLLGKAMEASKLPPVMPETQSLLALSQMPKEMYVAQGMNIEKAAEPVVRQIMERGGMPASLLEGMSSRTVSPLTVYHGSPAKFERFDPTKIGSGEGAQAYGYGHYVAESPGVAREYQKNLANPIKDQTDTAFITARTAFVKGDGDIKKAMKYLDQQQKITQDASGFLVDKGQKSLSDIEQARELLKSGAMQPGNLYEIDLPDEQIAKMLDWDKPISQQKDVMAALNSVAEKNVKAKVRNDIENEIRTSGVLPVDKTGDDYMSLLFGQSDETIAKADQMLKQLADEQMAKIDFAPLIKNELEGMKPATMTWDATGKDFYEMLAKRSGSPEKASALFKEQGIPGIRYLDQGSRSNFMVQNTVKGKPYGEPVSFMTERQAQDYAAEQIEKGFGTEIIPGTSNFVVFPGNEGLLTIQKRNNEVIAPTSLLDVPKQQTTPLFETGKEITFPFIKNTEKAPKMTGFGQDIEPAGNYILSGHDSDTSKLAKGWVSGEKTFKNPLVIDWGSGLYSDPDNWKNVLSSQYGGKTGKALSKAIAKDGYDGIVTMNKYGPSEIVDLTMFVK